MENQVVVYNIADEKIAEMSDKYMGLKLSGPNDKAGFNKIVEYRKEVKFHRVDVEKTRKELKAKSLKFGRDVDSEAKRLTELLLPIEDHLIEQENIVKKEKERLKAEEEKKIEDAHQARIKLVVNSGAVFNGLAFIYGDVVINDIDIWKASDESFEIMVEKIKIWKSNEEIRISEEVRIKKEEDERQAKIAESQKKEQERLDKIAEEQAEQALKIKEAQDKIVEENRRQAEAKRIEEAKAEAKIEAEKKHKLELDKAVNTALEAGKKHKKELEEARLKAIEDVKKEEAAKVEALNKKKLAEEKKAQMLPEKTKLLTLAQKFLYPNLPELKSQEGKIVIEEIKIVLKALSETVTESANKM